MLKWSDDTGRAVRVHRDGWGGTWEAARALDDRSAELLARYEAACTPYRAEVLPTDDLVHGDLNVRNILVAGGRVAAVIDVEAASGGTRAYDLIVLAASAARDGAAASYADLALFATTLTSSPSPDRSEPAPTSADRSGDGGQVRTDGGEVRG